jgi:hypothetical protein
MIVGRKHYKTTLVHYQPTYLSFHLTLQPLKMMQKKLNAIIARNFSLIIYAIFKVLVKYMLTLDLIFLAKINFSLPHNEGYFSTLVDLTCEC